jgi:hypothetical protein
VQKYKLALSENYARIKTEYIGMLGYAVNLGHMKTQQLPNIRPNENVNHTEHTVLYTYELLLQQFLILLTQYIYPFRIIPTIITDNFTK